MKNGAGARPFPTGGAEMDGRKKAQKAQKGVLDGNPLLSRLDVVSATSEMFVALWFGTRQDFGPMDIFTL